MDLVESIATGRGDPDRRLLGQNILAHTESLLSDGKLTEGQYLDFCNGAGLIHESIVITQHDAASINRLLHFLCEKVTSLKTDQQNLRNRVKTLQAKSRAVEKKYEETKGTVLRNAISLESAIKKKAYARARTMIENQRKEASDMVFGFTGDE
jgi:hypothetical protein